jgi:3-oxoacyl-[acyl-carrier protein] reductase
MLLQDHVALITGANRGIGRAIALAFAVPGARIAVTGRAVERCQPVVDAFAALGGEAQPFRLNVTRDAEVLVAGQSVLSVWGKIDILVHSAGIIQYHTPGVGH